MTTRTYLKWLGQLRESGDELEHKYKVLVGSLGTYIYCLPLLSELCIYH